MIRKVFLWLISIIAIILSIIMYLLINLDVDDLNLYYSEYKENTLYIYNSEGSLLGNYDCISDEDNCYLAYSYEESILDKTVIVDEVKKSINITVPILYNYAFIYDDSKVKLINLETKEEIETYRNIKYLNNEYIVLKNDLGKAALAVLSDSGIEYITDYIYDYIGQSDYSSYFLVSSDDYYYLINNLGNSVSNTFSNKITNYTDEYIVIYKNSSYVLFDYTGYLAMEQTLSYIKMDSNYLYLITNNLLSIYDNNLSLLNKESINLGVINNWSTYDVYNEDHKFLYTTSVFESSIVDNKLIITTENEEYTYLINN